MRERAKMEVSAATVIAGTVIVFLTGFASAWFIFGLDVVVRFGDSSGSRADWVAAFGTWLVGIAAALIAWWSHKQQSMDRIQRELREAREEALRLETIAIAMNSDNYRIRRFIELLALNRQAGGIVVIDRRELTEITDLAQRWSWDNAQRDLFSHDVKHIMLAVQAEAARLSTRYVGLKGAREIIDATELAKINELAELAMRLENAMNDDLSNAKSKVRDLQSKITQITRVPGAGKE